MAINIVHRHTICTSILVPHDDSPTESLLDDAGYANLFWGKAITGDEVITVNRGKPPLKIRRPRPDDDQVSPSSGGPPFSAQSEPVPRIVIDDDYPTPGGSLLRRLSDHPANGAPSLKDRMQSTGDDRSYQALDVDREYPGRRSKSRRQRR